MSPHDTLTLGSSYEYVSLLASRDYLKVIYSVALSYWQREKYV